MHPRCAGEASHPCRDACFPSLFLAHEDSHNTDTPNKSTVNVTASSHDFFAATFFTLHPHTQFTNHEALPSLDESYTNFAKAYPPFCNTSEIDQIRAREYHHLNLPNSNTCFDYTGYGLFSYAQQQQQQQQQRSYPATSIASSSSHPPPSLPYSALQPPFFDISYKPVNLQSLVLYGGHESELESRIRERIMAFMNISEADYTPVFVANEVSAFKLVAESFQFQSNGDLLTVYDHNSEALDAMVEICKEQGAHVLSAEFSWPSLGIRWPKLKKMIASKSAKRKRGLFVLPLHSRVTGAPYSYVWMSIARENGWHVMVDACALGPKEMDTLGLSLFKPDFLICSFYKVFGENPSGFGCLFVKKSGVSSLKDSGNGNPTSIGIVTQVPVFRQSQASEEFVITEDETEPKADVELQEHVSTLSTRLIKSETRSPPHETEEVSAKQKEALSSEIVELDTVPESTQSRMNGSLEIECRGLDHADSVGLVLISCRARYLINWLVNALMSLRHPHPEIGLSLIRIYGPKINLHRGPAVAFNVFDWKGEKIDPALVQKLADRNNISLANAFLQNIRFSDKNEEERQRGLETRVCEGKGLGLSKNTRSHDYGITVVTAALGFLTNFEDAYRLWAFLSRFLDADFVEKERWRYMALNQKTIDI